MKLGLRYDCRDTLSLHSWLTNGLSQRSGSDLPFPVCRCTYSSPSALVQQESEREMSPGHALSSPLLHRPSVRLVPSSRDLPTAPGPRVAAQRAPGPSWTWDRGGRAGHLWGETGAGRFLCFQQPPGRMAQERDGCAGRGPERRMLAADTSLVVLDVGSQLCSCPWRLWGTLRAADYVCLPASAGLVGLIVIKLGLWWESGKDPGPSLRAGVSEVSALSVSVHLLLLLCLPESSKKLGPAQL